MIESLSTKQIELFKAAYDNEHFDIIADGAVRSGKTLICSVAFVMWAMDNFDKSNFAICGKTVGSAIKNIVLPLLNITDLKKVYDMDFKRSYNCLTITYGKKTNWFYIYGGTDERSQDLIQGITLCGFLLDEAALMPQSFVNQAIARTLSVENAKRFYNCNPESPDHFIYTDFILKAEEKNIKRIHFLMEDNPSLTLTQIERAKNMYSGVFHQRFILGQWVRAEGLVYTKFANNTNDYLLEPDFKYCNIITANIGVDFGGNGSATTFVCTGFTKRFESVVVLEAERHPEELSPDELEHIFCDFVKRCTDTYGKAIPTYCDSAEQILIRGLRNEARFNSLRTNVLNARKMAILERIKLLNKLISQGRFRFTKRVPTVVKALQTAVWNSKVTDERLDDGTTDIDTLDALEYSIEPYFKELTDFIVR